MKLVEFITKLIIIVVAFFFTIVMFVLNSIYLLLSVLVLIVVGLVGAINTKVGKQVFNEFNSNMVLKSKSDSRELGKLIDNLETLEDLRKKREELQNKLQKKEANKKS